MSTATIELATAARMASSLGEPLSTWTYTEGVGRGYWEPTDLQLPDHLALADVIQSLPWSATPRTMLARDGRLLLTVGMQLGTSRTDRILLTGTFRSSKLDQENGWTLASLQRAAALACARELSEQARQKAESEVAEVSKNLASTYEEISLLHGLTRRLQLTNSQRELSELALEWLIDCLPTESIFLHYQPQTDVDPTDIANDHQRPIQLAVGACVLDQNERREFVSQLDANADYARGSGKVGAVSFPCVRQYLAVPLKERERCLGWLVALNHNDEQSFSSIEASLMRSVSTILGIHFANREHYEEQANLVADVVRALASAIDAKDPYTRGHSERVAKISVVLARQVGMEEEALRSIYIGGLLHDIGKIGVDDNVLRKEGKLTDEEYDQVKLHPGLGYNILADLKPLRDVLPIVLHHHERWDGRGYPHAIPGEEIELAARIAAVADSFDAMTSDRPYRRGMPLDKVEAILRDGAGSQWDANIIDAFFECRDEIIELVWKQEDGEDNYAKGIIETEKRDQHRADAARKATGATRS
ncbi:MAG: HD-GYP domain-containing protein [Planctomycetales bacterium]|nr:HD-GYP domain-containing protein [Planctomycetales bacterium]